MRRETGIAIAIAIVILVAAIARHIINANSLLFLLALVPSVILHEVSHGVVANLFGDDTAKRAGRLSLNPLVHIDLIGTLILPGLMILIGIPPIGYAKPVPVDVSRLRSPRNQSVLVALVGPAVNIALSIIGGLILHSVLSNALVSAPLSSQVQISNPLLVQFLVDFGLVNVALGIFNAIPLPPLDGSAVIERVLPSRWWPPYLKLRRFALPVLIGILLLAPSLLSHIILSVDQHWINIFVPPFGG